MAEEDRPNTKLTSIGLLLFPQFEVLDAAGPIELLNVLSLYLNHSDLTLSIIAPTLDPVSPSPAPSHRFLSPQRYLPTHTLATAPPLDLLLVPGGRGSTDKPNLGPVYDFIRQRYRGTHDHAPLKYLFSVCTGSEILGDAGVLDGHRATTNKRSWSRVTGSTRGTHWVAKARWVESGRVWTTSGVSAGMDGMLALIAREFGEEVAEMVCEVVEYRRIKDASDDEWAFKNGCEDVLPVT